MTEPVIELDARTAADIQLKKLSARSRHVNLLLGAGASKACGLPTIVELRDLVIKDIEYSGPVACNIFSEDRTLEQALSHLRRIRGLLRSGAAIQGFALDEAAALDEAVCASIVKHLSRDDTNIDAYRRLAAWINAQEYTRPIEIFTVNYDLLLERGFESERVHFFDGFVGTLHARFRADLVDIFNDRNRSLPPTCARLWKLHGSTNWKLVSNERGIAEVVRVGEAVDSAAAIYPSDEKYEDSRRMPFVALMDRFRRALGETESITIVAGYSFGDDDLNEVLFDSARLHPRSELWVTCFSDIPDRLRREALKYRNIVVHGSDVGITGGRACTWTGQAYPDIFEGGRLQLGDFAALTRVLLPGPLETTDAS